MKRVSRCDFFQDIHTAVASSTLELVGVLIEQGVNVIEQDAFGSTPLHRAAWQGDLGIVKLLLQKDSDANMRRVDGKTPLDLANLRTHGVGCEPPEGLSVEFDGGDFLEVIGLLGQSTRSDVVASTLRENTFEDDQGESNSTWNVLSCSSQASLSTCSSYSERRCRWSKSCADIFPEVCQE